LISSRITTKHKPPCGWRSVTKLGLKRHKTKNTFTKILDSKVGFMRWLGGVVFSPVENVKASVGGNL
jgi:hypothetical protein